MRLNNFDWRYKNLLAEIIEAGEWLETRGTRSKYIFGATIKHDMRQGFPASTLSNFYPKSAINEMFNFDLQSYGEVSEKYLSKGLLKIWKQYLKSGSNYLPGSYSENWRAWPANSESLMTIDQLHKVVKSLNCNPTSRSHVVQSYNPSVSYKHGGMPNCSIGLVFSSDGEHLDLLQTGRSLDAITGLRGDFCRYGALLELIGALTNLIPRTLQFTTANTHIYDYDLNDAKAMLNLDIYPLPRFNWKALPTTLTVEKNSWELIGYQHNNFVKTGRLDLGEINY